MFSLTPGQSMTKMRRMSAMYCQTFVSPGMGATLHTCVRKKATCVGEGGLIGYFEVHKEGRRWVSCPRPFPRAQYKTKKRRCGEVRRTKTKMKRKRGGKNTTETAIRHQQTNVHERLKLLTVQPCILYILFLLLLPMLLLLPRLLHYHYCRKYDIKPANGRLRCWISNGDRREGGTARAVATTGTEWYASYYSAGLRIQFSSKVTHETSENTSKCGQLKF